MDAWVQDGMVGGLFEPLEWFFRRGCYGEIKGLFGGGKNET